MDGHQRIEWIDMAKGVGLILVIYGHIPFRPEWWNVWLCSFHMPLFFFMAGITYNIVKYCDFKAFIRNKLKTLIVPYFIFAGITWIWNFLICVVYLLKDGTEIDFMYQLKQFLGIFLQIRTTSYGIGVWFIPCIFVTFLLLWLILKVAKSVYFRVLLAISCLLIGYLYCTYVDIKLPWGIDAAFIAVFFVSMGCFGQKFLKRELQNKKC